MRLKSYYAATVESAIRLARQELGDEAMLMSSRKAPAEARHLGTYEVVFAADAESKPQPRPPAAQSQPAARAVGEAGLTAEIAQIRHQIERMSAALRRTTFHADNLDPWLDEVYSEMTAAGIDADLAFQTARKLDRKAVAADPDQTRDTLMRELARCFTVSPLLGCSPDGGRKVVALVGPSGVGKTTSLVKLAVKYGLTSRKSTQILSVDTHRIAAAEQLRSYATILGLGFQAFESVPALFQALEEHSGKDLVLIDTPGYGPADFDLASELSEYLANHPDIDTHLVLSCTTNPADLSRVTERFGVFRPAKLIFTRLDEAGTYGAIVNESVRTGLPISFLTTGQRVPDDLEPASKARIADLVLGSRSPAAWSDAAWMQAVWAGGHSTSAVA
ncbi:MAG: hypothetical protein ACRD8O_22630 [Bryobacteraceae bacterium]